MLDELCISQLTANFFLFMYFDLQLSHPDGSLSNRQNTRPISPGIRPSSLSSSFAPPTSSFAPTPLGLLRLNPYLRPPRPTPSLFHLPSSSPLPLPFPFFTQPSSSSSPSFLPPISSHTLTPSSSSPLLFPLCPPVPPSSPSPLSLCLYPFFPLPPNLLPLLPPLPSSSPISWSPARPP